MSELRLLADRKVAATSYSLADLKRLRVLCAGWLDAEENSEAEDLMEHAMLGFHDEMLSGETTGGDHPDGLVCPPVVSTDRLLELLAQTTDEEDRAILRMALVQADQAIEADESGWEPDEHPVDTTKGPHKWPQGEAKERRDSHYEHLTRLTQGRPGPSEIADVRSLAIRYYRALAVIATGRVPGDPRASLALARKAAQDALEGLPASYQPAEVGDPNA